MSINGSRQRLFNTDSPALLTAANQRRQLIIEVAQRLFMQNGYSATSMSAIAADLGGSKATLYSYFGCKNDLFRACVEEACRSLCEFQAYRNTDERNIADVLTNFGEHFLGLVCSTRWSSLLRSCCESQCDQQTRQIFYQAGIESVVRWLEDIIAQARERDQIAARDCRQVAEDFISLLCGRLFWRRALGPPSTPAPGEIKAEAIRAARAVIRLYP